MGLILVHFRDSGQGRAWTRVGTRDLDVGSWSRDWREGLGTRETGDGQTADEESDGGRRGESRDETRGERDYLRETI